MYVTDKWMLYRICIVINWTYKTHKNKQSKSFLPEYILCFKCFNDTREIC